MAKTWKQRIQDAKKRGRFLWSDRDMAVTWLSCAVGERRKVQEIAWNNVWNEPKSARLMTLGGDFAVAVISDNVELAESIRQKIVRATP